MLKKEQIREQFEFRLTITLLLGILGMQTSPVVIYSFWKLKEWSNDYFGLVAAFSCLGPETAAVAAADTAAAAAPTFTPPAAFIAAPTLAKTAMPPARRALKATVGFNSIPTMSHHKRLKLTGEKKTVHIGFLIVRRSNLHLSDKTSPFHLLHFYQICNNPKNIIHKNTCENILAKQKFIPFFS